MEANSKLQGAALPSFWVRAASTMSANEGQAGPASGVAVLQHDLLRAAGIVYRGRMKGGFAPAALPGLGEVSERLREAVGIVLPAAG